MQTKSEIDQLLRQKCDAKEIPGVVAVAATGPRITLPLAPLRNHGLPLQRIFAILFEPGQRSRGLLFVLKSEYFTDTNAAASARDKRYRFAELRSPTMQLVHR